MHSSSNRSQQFFQLHAPGQLLVLPNAWDAGSARLIESLGAAAIATSSAGLSWAHGYPDGNALPTTVLAAAVAEIERVISVPLSVDIEGGYSNDPRAVGDIASAVIDAGGVGINLEDGTSPPELLCEKIAVVKGAAARAGVDLFVNARTDVYLRALVGPEHAVAESIARAQRYRTAGCDGIFVPGVHEPKAIQEIAASSTIPLNVLVWPNLAPAAELRHLGVRRLSAGASPALAAYGAVQRATVQLLRDGVYDAMLEGTPSARSINQLMSRA